MRIVVRRLLPGETGPSGGPAMTDLLGVCEEWTDADLAVRAEDGTLVRIPRELVVAGKPVPPRASTTMRVAARDLHRRALAMWGDLEVEPLGDWLLRSATGETARRANSTLALGDPGVCGADALAQVVAFHTARGAAPVICVEVGSAVHADVEAAGWVHHPAVGGDSLVQVAAGSRVRRALAALPALPDPPAEMVEDGPRVVLTVPGARGRAAHDADWVGLYGIETEPERRRRGLGLVVVGGLLAWAAERGATSAYLQVHASNAPAIALYERLGFATHHAYRYLVPPG